MSEHNDNKDQRTSLTKPALLMVTARSIAYAFTFLLPLLLVRWLSQEEFGLYKQVFLVVGTAMMVLPLGFGMSAYYFLPREQEGKAQVVVNILLFNLTMGGLACAALVLRPGILGQLFNSNDLVQYSSLIGLVILFSTVSSFIEIVAVAHQETGIATTFIVAAQITKTGLLLAAAAFFDSLESLIWAAVIQGLLQTTALIIYLYSRFRRYWHGFSWSMLKSQLSYALPLGLAGILFSLQNDLHNYFVANSFGAAAFAIYAIGCFQLPLVGILNDSVGSVMIPRVSELQQQNNRQEIILITAQIMRKLAAIYFPIYVFLLLMGREFITVLFTTRYLPSWPIFAVFLSLIPINILITDPILRAYAEQRYFLLRVKVAIFVMLFVALWFGIRHLSLVGVITIVVAANILERAIAAVRAARVLGVAWHHVSLVGDLPKLAAASICAGVVTALVYALLLGAKPFFVLCVCGATFSLCYLVAIFLLKIPSIEERAYGRQLINRLSREPSKRMPESLS